MEPGVEHEGRRRLPVPARADVGEPPDQARAPVLLLAHEGQVREVSFLGGPDVVERAEHRQGKRCVGEGILAAADDALTDPVGIALFAFALRTQTSPKHSSRVTRADVTKRTSGC